MGVWPVRDDETVEPFTAVVTTGIYCRPGCSARPRPENTVRFGVPAAAEAAGFRPCLRCRPERHPHPRIRDAPDLVCRGVALILDGVLDDDTEERLSDRLGVSLRHLRRLFADHVGVTPDGLARSARAHLSRRLLDETDLTVTEVAFAAGFGSVRQFNRDVQRVFGRSPSQLRLIRQSSERLVADGGLVLRLRYDGELDWAALVAHLAEMAIPGVEQVEAGSYRRTIVVRGDPGVLELRPGGVGWLTLTLHLPHWEELVHIVGRARRLGSLDLNLPAAAAHLATDDQIGSAVRDRPGVRPPGAWDGFEVGVAAILRHHLGEAHARTVLATLAFRLGAAVPGLAAWRLNSTFPEPQALMKADLARMGIPAAAAHAVTVFTQATLTHQVRLDRSMVMDDLVSALEKAGAMPPAAAQYLALRLGETDTLPFDEQALPGHQRWRPWRSVAAAQLWALQPPVPVGTASG